jgi:sialic acid synthase SpsE
MTEIILEIGVNHDGELDKARRMVNKIKELGLGVAKFQLYSFRTKRSWSKTETGIGKSSRLS